ncbi:hypothetical protein LL946_08015 [Knoellia locipacati]|uniref:hypothetical protein n=1 Tax=Knoellia locipacati TaxID=882824 RepID=UPI00384B001B
MGVVEFEMERIIHAPIEDVFDRLADIDGHNDWMPTKGTILHHSEKTSPGPIGVGTTFLDQTIVGWTPGDVTEFERPTTLVYHWWDKTRRGKVTAEGWPGYRLEAKGDHTTLVHHHARLETHGLYRLATPVLHWLAVRERTATIDALELSFGRHEY